MLGKIPETKKSMILHLVLERHLNEIEDECHDRDLFEWIAKDFQTKDTPETCELGALHKRRKASAYQHFDQLCHSPERKLVRQQINQLDQLPESKQNELFNLCHELVLAILFLIYVWEDDEKAIQFTEQLKTELSSIYIFTNKYDVSDIPQLLFDTLFPNSLIHSFVKSSAYMKHYNIQSIKIIKFYRD